MVRLLRQSLLYLVIIILGGVVPIIAPAIEPARSASAEETQCVGRKTAVETPLGRVETLLQQADTMILPNSENSITKGDLQKDNDVTTLRRINAQLDVAKTSLLQFAQNKCGQADFEAFYRRYLNADDSFSRHLGFASNAAATDGTWPPYLSQEIPLVRRKLTITYDSDSTDCRLLILAAENKIQLAELNMNTAEPTIEQWRIDQKDTERASGILDAARKSLSEVQKAI